MNSNNRYTHMQKQFYMGGTTNHIEHNANPDYWDILLGDLKDGEKFKGKKALDFACGKGRNVTNLLSLCEWERVDGVDISKTNIEFCNEEYSDQKSKWFINNGVDVACIEEEEYDFIMSTIALQHIPVYSIRRSLIADLLRTLKPGGIFCFQMGYGLDLQDPLGRPRSSYYEEIFEAHSTNSDHDVRVQNTKEICDDLIAIGFINITTTIRDAFSDAGHPSWIYIRCHKPVEEKI